MTGFYRQLVLCGVIVLLFVVFTASAHAAVVLGSPSTSDQYSGTGYLIGGTVVDPTNSIRLTNDLADPMVPAEFDAAKWLSATVSTNNFYKKEGAAAMFSNSVGRTDNKWYAATQAATITLQFPSAFTLTHFTLSSGNDSLEARTPSIWSVQGSNDGVNWHTIYGVDHSDTTTYPTAADRAKPFTDVNQTILFTSFTNSTLASSGLTQAQQATVSGYTIDSVDYVAPAAYAYYRFNASNPAGGDASAQLGELELFGYSTVKTKADTNGGLFPTSAYHMDAATVTGNSGDKVATWADVNGKPLSFTQTDEGQQPTLTTANGLPALKFINSRMLLGGSSPMDTQMLFIVSQVDASQYNAYGGLIGTGNTTPTEIGIRMNGDSAGDAYWLVEDNDRENDFVARNEFYNYNGNIMNPSNKNASQTGYYLTDLNLLTAVKGSSKSLNNNIWIGNYFGENRYFNGDIAEVVAFSYTLNDLETKVVQTYLGSKYGLAMAPGSVFETGGTGYGKDFFYLAKTDNWDVRNNGAGGFGLATLPGSDAAFDIFGTPLQNGETLTVASNLDTAFGLSEIITDAGQSFDIWEKSWYIDATGLNGTTEFMWAFNAADAMYTGRGIDGETEWSLLFSDDNGTYSVLGNVGTFTEGMLEFMLSLSGADSGYFSLGLQGTAGVPEPSAWVLMALGLLAGCRMLVRRRK